jgi:hypothetical protein
MFIIMNGIKYGQVFTTLRSYESLPLAVEGYMQDAKEYFLARKEEAMTLWRIPYTLQLQEEHREWFVQSRKIYETYSNKKPKVVPKKQLFEIIKNVSIL